MSKMTRRIISLMLSVLMVLSAVSVFVIPASAEETETETETVQIDYEAAFEGAYLIDQNWTKKDLVNGNIIEFTYRGETRKVVCDTDKHFNNWAEAEASAYSLENVTAQNVYTYTPVFIFSAGVYSETIHVPIGATILGANAGISPNAALKDGDWSVDGVSENGGWAENPERDTENETVFTSTMFFATRVGSNYSEQPTDGREDSRFAYFLEQANSKKQPINVTVDGVKLEISGRGMEIHHYDINSSLVYPAGAKELTNSGKRELNVTFQNVDANTTSTIICAWNGAHNLITATVKDSSVSGVNASLITRDIKNVNIDSVYFHDVGSSFSLWFESSTVGHNLHSPNNGSGPYAQSWGYEVSAKVNNCLFYNLDSSQADLVSVGAKSIRDNILRDNETKYFFDITNNIFYNARGEGSGSDAGIIQYYQYDDTSRVTANITGNIFHQDAKTAYAPMEYLRTHKSKLDPITYEDNTVSGDFINKEPVEPADFNKALAEGITVRGVKFTAEDTVVVSPDGAVKANADGTDVEDKCADFYYAYFGGVRYKFTIDNKNVFVYKRYAEGHTEVGKMDLTAYKDFDNIILPTGTYSHELLLIYPVNIYGNNFGISPNDTTTATADNEYDWEMNEAYDTDNQTIVNSIAVSGKVEWTEAGEVVIDGIKGLGRIWDNQRKIDAAPLNFTVKNALFQLYNNPGNSYFITLSNSRTLNGRDITTNTVEENIEFGKTYNDTFTLQNVRFLRAGGYARMIDEFVPAHVVFDGVYYDATEANRTTPCFGFFKVGALNMNTSLTIKNCNLRNQTMEDAGKYYLLFYQGVNGSFVDAVYGTSGAARYTSLAAGQTAAVNITDNIFVNAANGTNGNLLGVAAGVLSSLKINNNTFVDTNDFVGNILVSYAVNGASNTDLLSDIELNGNTIVGYTAEQKAIDLGYGESNPAWTNTTDSITFSDGTTDDTVLPLEFADIENMAINGKEILYLADDRNYVDEDGVAHIDLEGIAIPQSMNKLVVEIGTVPATLYPLTVTVSATSYNGSNKDSYTLTLTNVDPHVYSTTGTPCGDKTCVDAGTMTVECTGCAFGGANCTAKKTVADTGVDPNAHKWNDGVYNNDATCKADGTKTQTCTLCKAATQKVTVSGTKVSHLFEESAYKSNGDATCGTDGTETAKCKWCTATDTRTNADKYPATGNHVWGEFVYNNDATEEADGTKTAKCKTPGCTDTKTETAAGTKLPASDDNDIEYEDTPDPVDATKKFKDVKNGKWYTKAINHAATYGLVAGVEDDLFGLDVTITRGMFITILARVAGVDTSKAANKAATTKFTDVKAGKYYAAAIAWASSKDVVAGITKTQFKPDDPITRQQLCVMIVNFAKAENVALTPCEDAITFADASSIAKWAKDAVAVCQKADIVNGYKENGKYFFKPDNTATRAEATQMLYVFHYDYYLYK